MRMSCRHVHEEGIAVEPEPPVHIRLLLITNMRSPAPHPRLLHTCYIESAGSAACFVDVSGMMLGKGFVFCLDLLSCADFGFVYPAPPPSPPVLVTSLVVSCYVMSLYVSHMVRLLASSHVLSAFGIGIVSFLMSCHVMSWHVVSWHVVSYHVTSCRVMSCHAMSCHASLLRELVSCASRHVLAGHVTSCHVISCHVMSCLLGHVMSRSATRCPVISAPVSVRLTYGSSSGPSHVLSCNVLSCHAMMQCHVLPCTVMSCYVLSGYLTRCPVISAPVTYGSSSGILSCGFFPSPPPPVFGHWYCFLYGAPRTSAPVFFTQS